MNNNDIDGELKKVKGSVKEALGKVTGNDRLEDEGASEKRDGKILEALGKTNDTAKSVARKPKARQAK